MNLPGKLTVVALIAFCANTYGQTATFTNQLDAAVNPLLKEFHVPGAAIAVIEKGKLVYSKGYGVSDDITRQPIKPATVFPVASISKTVTAIGVLKLADEGKINLDSSYFKYVKRWRIPASAFDESKITIRQLLSHTAGVSGRSPDYYLKKEEVPSIEQELTKNKAGRPAALIDTPGRAWRYSGNGYLMLQLLIEEVSGKKFETYMQEEVFRPLKMTHSSFLPDQQTETKVYDQNLKQTPLEYFTSQAAASLNTNIIDFSSFVINALESHNHFLSDRILNEAFKPAAGSEGTYGLGLFIERSGNDVLIIGHDGADPGVRSIFKLNPATGDAVIIFTNSSYGNSVFNNVLCKWYPMVAGFTNTGICSPASDKANLILISIYAEGVAKAKELSDREVALDKSFNMSEAYLSYWAYGLQDRGFGEDAILMLQFDIAANPGNANAYDSLADIYLKNGKKKEALTAYKKLLELDPGNKNAIENMSRLQN